MTRPLVQPIVPGSAAARTLYGLLAGEPVVTVRADLGEDPYRVLAHVLAWLSLRCPEDATVSMMVDEPAHRVPMVELLEGHAGQVTRVDVEPFDETYLNFWPSARQCLSLEVWSENDPDRGGPLIASHLLIIDPSRTPSHLWSPFVGAGQLLLVGSAEDPNPAPGREALDMITDSFRARWGELPVEIILAGTD